MYTRKPDWEQSLIQWAEDIQRKRFRWGLFDCVLISLHCLQHICNNCDLYDRHVDRYHSQHTAYKYLISNWGSLSQAFDDEIGNPINPNLSQRGEPVLASLDGNELIVTNLGNSFIVPTEQYGITSISLHDLKANPGFEIKKGWRI